ncbi:MAG: SIMPL domain-containing protein [Holosporaceae bacterium]|jgi:hypothetical protein|nr:SIMPL domain-containing protein [Holosporaceae bacterium]
MKYSYISASIIIACGLVGFGYFSSKNIKASSELVEVKGLSEKVVRANIGEMTVIISNSDDNFEKLYKKRISDKDKVIGFLKSQGITEEEIINSSMDASEYEEENKTISSGVTTVKKHKYFKTEDKINIRTKDIGKIQKIKEGIAKLSSEGVWINYNYSYPLTNFSDIKMEMMQEASENAKKNAEAFIKPYKQKISTVVYLKQGEITIRGEDEAESIESWNSKESTSINKKLRLVIRAGFAKSKK